MSFYKNLIKLTKILRKDYKKIDTSELMRLIENKLRCGEDTAKKYIRSLHRHGVIVPASSFSWNSNWDVKERKS